MSIRGHIKLLGAVALISVVVLSGVNLYKIYLYQQRVVSIQKFIKFNLIINDFLEQIQKERLLSVVFITSSGAKEIENGRPIQLEAVENQIKRFEEFTSKINFKLYDGKYEILINQLKKDISYRDVIRKEIKNQKKGVDSVVKYFSKITSTLIDIASVNAKITPEGEVAKNLNSYVFFLKAKEVASIRLAIFSQANMRSFSQEFINKMIKLNTQERFYLEIFSNIVNIKLVKLYEKKVTIEELDFTKNLAQKALNIIMEGDDDIQSEDWFNIILTRSNNFEQIDDILLKNISSEEKIGLTFYSLIFGMVATLFILLSIYLLSKNINKRVHSNDWIFEPQ